MVRARTGLDAARLLLWASQCGRAAWDTQTRVSIATATDAKTIDNDNAFPGVSRLGLKGCRTLSVGWHTAENAKLFQAVPKERPLCGFTNSPHPLPLVCI